jgi:hypothetical protein
MKPRARFLLGLWVLLAGIAMVLWAAQGDLFNALLTPAPGVFAGVAALILSRRPGNAVGSIMLAVPFLLTFSDVLKALFLNAQGRPHDTDVSRLLVWADSWLSFVLLGLVTIVLPLRFPDGRLPSPRWRPFLWGALAVVAAAIVGTAFGSPRSEWGDEKSVDNPLALGGATGEFVAAVESVATTLLTVAVLGALAGVAIRFRRSKGLERQQFKLFAYAIALMLIGVITAALSSLHGDLDALALAGWVLFLLALGFGLPLAIGTAILRHRLYDIDVVINRTLVYGALTATLALAYLGCVLLFQLALDPLTEASDLAVAGSTLAVAALFGPARSRIQAGVDRRFYRRRYNAGRTLEEFSLRLRDELDVDALGVDLRGVVRKTMNPASVSLWLRHTDRSMTSAGDPPPASKRMPG